MYKNIKFTHPDARPEWKHGTFSCYFKFKNGRNGRLETAIINNAGDGWFEISELDFVMEAININEVRLDSISEFIAGCQIEFDDHSRIKQVKDVIKEWNNKTGHDRCWYYPELLKKIAEIVEEPIVTSHQISRKEFEEGCKRYQDEQYGVINHDIQP